MSTPLREHLEEITAGSEKLDKIVCEFLGVTWSPDEGGQFGGYGIMPRRVHLTRNVGAAIAQIPGGVFWEVGTNYGEGGFAEIRISEITPKIKASAETPALALCAALVGLKQGDGI